jgi:hypothetical protein
MRRKLLAFVSATALLYLSGAAQPTSSHTHVVKIMDYDRTTDVVAGYPNGEPPLGWYQRTSETQHLPALVGPFFPPNPCKGLIIAWNQLLRQSTASNSSELQVDDDRRRAFGRLLLRMAQHQCNAEILSDTSRSPEPIVSIRPVP